MRRWSSWDNEDPFADIPDDESVAWPRRRAVDWGRGGRLAATTGRFAAAVKRHFPRTRRGRVVAMILCACVLLSCVSTAAASPAVFDALLARDGLTHLKNAAGFARQLATNPLNAATIKGAEGEFAAAYSDFSRMNATIGLYAGGLGWLPRYGSLVGAAGRLVPLAVEASQAGMIACDMLALVSARLHNPLDATSQGLTRPDFAVITRDFDQLQAIFNSAVDQINQLQPADLAVDPRLGPAVQLLRQNLPRARQLVNDLRALLPVAPALLGVGQPANYLVEVLDSAEMRPGGGFIGNYGIATITGGRLTGLEIQDVTLLDRQGTGVNAMYEPPGYTWLYEFPGSNFPFFGFRESNLEADFRWSAQLGEQLYAREAQHDYELHLSTTPAVPVQGVIAITPWLVQKALATITGPIILPEFNNQTVSADNLVNSIHAAQLGPGHGSNAYDPISGSSQRKRFSRYLFKHFFEQIKRQMSTSSGKIARLFVEALHSKDLQIYLNAPAGEALLQHSHLASTIEAPPTGDSFLMVDANVNAEKDNYFMGFLARDRVTLDEAGTATHHATFIFTFPYTQTVKQYDIGYTADISYLDYFRIYAPPGTTWGASSGWIDRSASTMFQRAVWAGYVRVLTGGTATLALTWRVPGAAIKDATGWHYRELLQRQAGLIWPLNLQVTLPRCASRIQASVTNISGSPAAVTGRTLPPASMPTAQVPGAPNNDRLSLTGGPAVSGQSVTLNQVLTEDRTAAIDYACA